MRTSGRTTYRYRKKGGLVSQIQVGRDLSGYIKANTEYFLRRHTRPTSEGNGASAHSYLEGEQTPALPYGPSSKHRFGLSWYNQVRPIWSRVGSLRQSSPLSADHPPTHRVINCTRGWVLDCSCPRSFGNLFVIITA